VYTNADITLYSCSKDGKYTRTEIKEVFWQEVYESNIGKTGLITANSLHIFIPLTSVPNGLNITTSKDLVVKGIVQHEFDNTSQATIATSMKTLKESHTVYTVTVSDCMLYGSKTMQHYQLSCK